LRRYVQYEQCKKEKIHEEVQNGNLGIVLTEEEVAVAETKEK